MPVNRYQSAKAIHKAGIGRQPLCLLGGERMPRCCKHRAQSEGANVEQAPGTRPHRPCCTKRRPRPDTFYVPTNTNRADTGLSDQNGSPTSDLSDCGTDGTTATSMNMSKKGGNSANDLLSIYSRSQAHEPEDYSHTYYLYVFLHQRDVCSKIYTLNPSCANQFTPRFCSFFAD